MLGSVTYEGCDYQKRKRTSEVFKVFIERVLKERDECGGSNREKIQCLSKYRHKAGITIHWVFLSLASAFRDRNPGRRGGYHIAGEESAGKVTDSTHIRKN